MKRQSLLWFEEYCLYPSLIEPREAPVKPRVLVAGNSVPLEDEIRALIESRATGAIAVVGPPGSGKTTALQHILAVFGSLPSLTLRDNAGPAEFPSSPTNALCIFTTTSVDSSTGLLATYRLAAWTRDDLIEYLLATAKERCGSVMSRLTADEVTAFCGIPEIARVVCDQLARDESVVGAKVALIAHLEKLLPNRDLIERAGSACLTAIVRNSLDPLVQADLPPGAFRIARHRSVQMLLAAARIAVDIRENKSLKCLQQRLPRELVRATAEEMKADQATFSYLNRLRITRRTYCPMAASLLHAAGVLQPRFGRRPFLQGAYLERVVLPGAKLVRAQLREADLTGANLRNANLTQAILHKAHLSGAKLNGAAISRAQATNADLSFADLSGCNAERASFDASDLEGAIFDRANLKRAQFRCADLTRAILCGADLGGAVLTPAILMEADFSRANLDEANISGQRLRDAEFRGASFAMADLRKCDLEGMDLPGTNFDGANLKGAWLSDSRMPAARFDRACLRDCGLADIAWEGASLRGADLRGATFHMGGTRSGLVFSPVASEGSRTGFYTDEYEEQHFKSPEEIRKANLCRADLRGARIEGVDFYLVDLRNAVFDQDQEAHFRRCGAILEARV